MAEIANDGKGSIGIGPRGAIVLEVLAAAAGISAFVAFVGGALMWLRLHELGLPADRMVAELPRELLLTLGANTLVVPAIVGVVATIVLYALPKWTMGLIASGAFVAAGAATFAIWDAISDVPVGWKLLAPGLAAVAVGLVAGALVRRYCAGILSDDHPLRRVWLTAFVMGTAGIGLLGSVYNLPVVPHMLIVIAAAFLGGVAIVAAQVAAPNRRPVYWVVFVTFLLVGAGLALARTAHTPKLEPVAVLLDGPQQEIAGFYIGEWDDRIHIAQLKRPSGTVGTSGEPVEAVVSVSSSRVTRMALRSPSGLADDEAGRAEAEALLEELVLERSAPKEEIAEPVATTNPVATFAPLLSLHSKEDAWPTAVGYFLRGSTLKWAFPGNCGRRDLTFNVDMSNDRQWGQIKTLTHPGACGGADHAYSGRDYTRPYGKGRSFKGRPELTGREGFYLDLRNRLRRPKRPATTQEGAQQLVKDVPVYYEQRPEPDAPESDERITYWFFYPYSVPPGGHDKIAHEGDWERISVLVRRVDDGLWRPLSVRYHEHDTHIDVPWAAAPRVAGTEGERTHPRGFVARGSHATYRRSGRHRQVLAVGRIEILRVNDDARACPACPLWYTWQNLVEATSQSWYGFGGAWGGVGDITGSTGPLGPSVQKTLNGREPNPTTSLKPSVAPPTTAAPAEPARAKPAPGTPSG